MDELHDNILMRFSAVIHDPGNNHGRTYPFPATLLPTGLILSVWQNMRCAEGFPGYAGYCRSIQVVEEERNREKCRRSWFG